MISWIASGLTLLGNVILIRKRSWKAFVIFFVGNAIWFYYWFSKQEWAAMILVGVFLLQNIWGIWSWRKK